MLRAALLASGNTIRADDISLARGPAGAAAAAIEGAAGDSFAELIGRHFRQPAEGLGNDDSPTAHMWRTMIDPTKPL